MQLTISAKCSIIDIWQGSEYVSAFSQNLFKVKKRPEEGLLMLSLFTLNIFLSIPLWSYRGFLV